MSSNVESIKNHNNVVFSIEIHQFATRRVGAFDQEETSNSLWLVMLCSAHNKRGEHFTRIPGAMSCFSRQLFDPAGTRHLSARKPQKIAITIKQREFDRETATATHDFIILLHGAKPKAGSLYFRVHPLNTAFRQFITPADLQSTNNTYKKPNPKSLFQNPAKIWTVLHITAIL